MPMLNKWTFLGLILVLLTLVVAACSDDDSDGDGNGNGNGTAPSVCDKRDDLRQSVDELAQLDVIAVGTNGLKAAAEQVRSDAESLTTLVGTEVASEAAALTVAIGLANTTFSTLDDQESLLAATADVAIVIATVAVTGDDLIKALSFECD